MRRKYTGSRTSATTIFLSTIAPTRQSVMGARRGNSTVESHFWQRRTVGRIGSNMLGLVDIIAECL